MSDTDSFIEEVTEEVRRDQLFAMYKRYGWIAVVVILGIVGGVGWTQYRDATETAAAQALGDSLIAATQPQEARERAQALGNVVTESAGGSAVVAMMQADALIAAGDIDGAAAAFASVENNADVPLIYRQIAAFKSLLAQSGTLDADSRRAGFEALAVAGAPLRLLAEEQLALIEIENANSEAAIERLQGILQDAEVSQDLMQRAAQLIVSLGGSPDMGIPTQG